MRTSHFAKIEVVVPNEEYTPGGNVSSAKLKTVGMANTISIEDNFGSVSENVVGTPLPVMAPGYQVTNIRMEKATIDGNDFRNLGAFNPLWGHVGSSYQNRIAFSEGEGSAVGDLGLEQDGGNESMYPFMFLLSVRNKVSDSPTESSIDFNDNPAVAGSNARSNPFGVYVCILSSATISMSAQQVIIMDNINAIARPLSGGWFNEAISKAYADDTNGMADIVNSVLFGFR